MWHRLGPDERAVVYLLGVPKAVKGPGLVITKPFLETIRRVDVGENLVQVRHATVTFRVADPIKAVHEVADCREAMARLVETVSARLFAGSTVERFASERADIAAALRAELEAAAGAWGIVLDRVEVNR
jgi:regulator of protease activity HflC (stomatin/prohibitin superfamily)